VRLTNIMVARNQHGDDKCQWHARLVDFDWSGPVGNVTHQRRIRTSDGHADWKLRI
jgi:hypothetical protein